MELNPYESPSVSEPMRRLVSRDGKHCPICLIDIGVFAVVKAPLPDRVRCPHCHARLTYLGGKRLVAVACCVLFGFLIGLFFVLDVLGVTSPAKKLIAMLSALVLLGLLSEFLGTHYLRTYGKLVTVD
jgi:hypothetical protein